MRFAAMQRCMACAGTGQAGTNSNDVIACSAPLYHAAMLALPLPGTTQLP